MSAQVTTKIRLSRSPNYVEPGLVEQVGRAEDALPCPDASFTQNSDPHVRAHQVTGRAWTPMRFELS